MDNKKNMAETRKYTIELSVLSGTIFLTIFFAQIHKMGLPISSVEVSKMFSSPYVVFLYLIFIAPFLFLSFQCAKWIWQGRSFTQDQFVRRTITTLILYFAYLIYWVLLGKGRVFVLPLYLLSIPFLGFIYRNGYVVITVIYRRRYPNYAIVEDKGE